MKNSYSAYRKSQENIDLDTWVGILNETQVKRMETNETNTQGYNPENAVETKGGGNLTPDSILDAVVIGIEDGTVKDFVNNTEKWEGSVDAPAINLQIEVQLPDKVLENTTQVFTYRKGDNGETAYHPTSNLGKFKAKYGTLPKAGTPVKIITDSSGFGKVKLD